MKNLYLLILICLGSTVSLAQDRVSTDLLNLYTFQEGSGRFVHDVSNNGTPLILRIHQESNVTWLPEGGLQINAPTLIRSLAGADELNMSVVASGEITLEAWVIAEDSEQSGPARIVTISSGASNRNAMLGQDGQDAIGRFRTSTTGSNGTPNLVAQNTFASNLQHVVYIRNANGDDAIYLDGALQASGSKTGNLDNWNLGYHLALANEIAVDRPWLGTLKLIATYDRALTAAEIQQNFDAGANQPGAEPTAEMCANEICHVNGFGADERTLWIPNLPGINSILYEFDEDGGTFDVFEDGTAHMYGHSVNIENPNVGFYMDFWFRDRMNWEEWSGLGRSWKGAPGIVGDLYETWDYFIMDDTHENVLIGTGDIEGSVLNCTHKPSSYQYGLQVGTAANDQNQEPGLSCWFDYTGNINGDEVDGNGDINLEGSCDEVPVMNCAIDVYLDCMDASVDPDYTGTPTVYCEDVYTLTYSDEVLSTDCPLEIIRTWTATNENGEAVDCTQTIVLQDNDAPVITGIPSELQDCYLDALDIVVTDNCDANPVVEMTTSVVTGGGNGDCDQQLRTQTQGGWGNNPNGNNPGMYLANNFDAAFPNGVSIGCDNTLTLTSASAVQAFLPSGSSPSALPDGNMVDPGGAYNNVLAGQLMAISISIGLDAAIPSFGESDQSLGGMIVQSGDFAGFNVSEVVAEANQFIGGCNSTYSASQLNEVLSAFNENYVDGTQNNGFLDCPETSDCAADYTVTITATDACGNVATITETIVLIDTDAPVITSLPENLTVDCGSIPEPFIEFNDGCFTENVEVIITDEEFSGTCFPTIQRTYALIDACGNETTHVQYITVIDSEAPVFLYDPADLVLNCGDDIPDFVPEVADNCSAFTVTETEESTPIECGFLIVRSWTATDGCGNASSVSQQVFLNDNEGPEPVSLPVDIAADCSSIPSISEIEFIDACGLVLVINSSEEQVGEGCEYLLVRTWEAFDVCGNTTAVSQTVTVTDSEAPVFISVPEDLVLECGATEPLGDPVVQDLCSSFDVVYDEVIIDTPESCVQIQRTWTATDNCGNSSTAQQLVTYIDAESPTLVGIPSSGEASCSGLEDAPVVTAVDNCDDFVPVFMDESITTEACTITIHRTWTATDLCGNESIAEQTLVLVDATAPFVSGVPSITVECAEFQTAELVTVEDDCQFAVQLTYTDELLSGDPNGCNQQLLRTWVGSDACGNESIFQQTISIVDESGPEFTFVPEDLVLSCVGTTPTDQALAEDACSDVDVTLEEIWSEGDCGNVVTRVWTATDACGNTSTATQTVSFTDQDAPVIEGDFTTVEINCSEALPVVPEVEITDNCANDVNLAYTELIVEGDCQSDYTLMRTWTATDACGNQAVVNQSVIVSDTTAPVFDFTPEDITAACGTIPEAPFLTASDNCSAVSMNYDESFDVGGCPNIYRTWTAIDACGNATEFVQIVFVEDTEPPLLLGVPDNVNVDCNSIPEMPEPEVSDNCDEDVALTVNESIIGAGCSYTIIRTWIASDDCGNTTISSQSITVEDTEAPVFVDTPAEMTVECGMLNGLPYPVVSDDCDNIVTITFVDVPLGSGCSFDVERTYTATDLCGHSASEMVLLHVVDTTAPVISGVGQNTYVSCDQIPDPNNAVAFDACAGEVPVTYTDSNIGEGCSYIISRTYFAEDPCNNIMALTQLIYVQDGTGPSLLGVPEDATIECTDPLPEPAFVGAIDNCDADVTVNYAQLVEEVECATIYRRFWSATDACGNQTTVIQVITQTDLTAPVFVNAPTNIETTCDNIPEIQMPTALDACDLNVVVTVVEELIEGGCPYEIRRTFIATDACGNERIALQQIFVTDEIAPVFVSFPEDLTIACDELGAPEAPTAEDNCSDLYLFVEEHLTNLPCGQVLERIWTAIDLCGNTISRTQTIELIDNAAPIFTEVPADLTINCLEVPAMVMLPFYDACGVTNSEMEEIITSTACETEYSILRVWTISDACGQTTTFTQNIEVIDDIAPILTNVPNNETVNCEDIPAIPIVEAYDGCGENVAVEFTEEIIFTDETDDGCYIDNSNGLSGSIALWLPGIDGIGSDYVYGPDGGSLVADPVTGELVLTGQVFNTLNANFSWMLNVRLGEERTWDEWSALGRDYKDDLGIGADFYQDWMYYVLNGAASELIGLDAFEGSLLNLTHAPADTTFGFQLGMNANNYSAGDGLGGWFFFEGLLNGVPVSGHGDIFTENDCCPEHEIIRTWTAIDCAGNSTVYVQVISVMNEVNSDDNLIVFPDDPGFDFSVATDGTEFFTVAFEPDFTGMARIELFDISGNLIELVKEWSVIEGAVYKLHYSKSKLNPGMYVFTAAGDNRIKADRGLVMR
jgi:hypothetical protein